MHAPMCCAMLQAPGLHKKLRPGVDDIHDDGTQRCGLLPIAVRMLKTKSFLRALTIAAADVNDRIACLLPL